MNYQQTFLALGSLILFSTVVLTVQNAIVDHQSALVEAAAAQYAIPLAQTYLEEAQGKAFDKRFFGGVYADTTDLTPAVNLGPDGLESYPQFDDVDDFAGLHRSHTGVHGSFTVDVDVFYVSPSDPDSAVSYRTRLKRMEVAVAGEALPDTLRMSQIFAAFRTGSES